MKRYESEPVYNYPIGLAAAVLGERETAFRVMNELKIFAMNNAHGGEARALGHASVIAAILGDTSTAEALMWEYRKKDRKVFDSFYLGQFATAAEYNPEAAYHLLQALEKEGHDVGWIAANILEILDSPLPPHVRTQKPPEPPGKQNMALELVSLKFFESGQDIPDWNQWQYSTRFQQNTARYIMYRLNMRKLQKGRDLKYHLQVYYYYPDWSTVDVREFDQVAPSDHEQWSSGGGIGWDKPGHWKPGVYHVKMLINGDTFAEESFTIESGEVATPDTRCERVVFAEKAYLAVVAETHEHTGTETGGVLLGHQEEGVWYVLEALDPGPNALFKPASFMYDGPYVNHLIKKTARLYKHSLELLGFWHVHPNGTDTFSPADDSVNTTYAARRERGAISGLVNPDPQFRLTMYHVTLPLHYTKVSVDVGDSLIPKDMFAVRSLTEFLKNGEWDFKTVDMALDRVIRDGGWRGASDLVRMSLEDKRNILIVEMSNHTYVPEPHFFQGFDTETLIGKAAILVFLIQAGIRDIPSLKVMSDEEQRNTLIAENVAHTQYTLETLQGMNNRELVQVGLSWFRK